MPTREIRKSVFLSNASHKDAKYITTDLCPITGVEDEYWVSSVFSQPKSSSRDNQVYAHDKDQDQNNLPEHFRTDAFVHFIAQVAAYNNHWSHA